jgi:glycosyltransferase 2 family protein
MRKRPIRYLLSILLTAGFLWLAFRGTDFASVFNLMKGAKYWWMVLMLTCLIVSHCVRAWRWRYLLEPMKPSIGFRNLFSGVMIGYMVNNFLPRVGELVRPYTIGKLEGIPKSAALGTIVVERIIDGIAFLILIALMPLVYDGPLRESFPWLDDARVAVSIMTLGGIVVLVALALRRNWADSVIRSITRILPHRFGQRIEALVHSFLDGFLFLKTPQHLPLILFQSFLVWFLYILMVYFAFFSFNLDLDFKAAVVVQAISSMGVAVPTPGATGSYHVFTTQCLTKLFGMPKNVALSYATLTHAVGFVGVTVIGLFFFFKDHISVSEAVQKTVDSRT